MPKCLYCANLIRVLKVFEHAPFKDMYISGHVPLNALVKDYYNLTVTDIEYECDKGHDTDEGETPEHEGEHSRFSKRINEKRECPEFEPL